MRLSIKSGLSWAKNSFYFAKRKKVNFFAVCFFVLAVGLIFIFRQALVRETFEESPDLLIHKIQKEPSLIGLPCENQKKRPLAVALANDPQARPLSGLFSAELVIEMPVITGGITRLLAFYQCFLPEEIGSLRSARHDFIPLAMGFDAVLVHWGGSHFALEKLRKGAADNLDALTNPFSSFYRKDSLPRPHNGFTSAGRLWQAIEKIGYRVQNQWEGYSRFSEEKGENTKKRNIEIGYPYPYNVLWRYQEKSGLYERFRAGEKELDSLNQKQIKAKNIIIMRVPSVQIEGQYNDLNLEGEGPCQVYQGGKKLDCFWQKSEKFPTSPLLFVDRKAKQEIPLAPGKIWIEIVQPDQTVSWF